MNKSVIYCRIEPSAIPQFHQLHYRIQHNLLIKLFKRKIGQKPKEKNK